jgi:L-aspartate oxidase
MQQIDTDFLVIGSGLAGLTFALAAAAHGKVTVLAKKELTETNSWRAQGGIAAVVAAEDSTESHVVDTLVAGAGLCREQAVRFVVERGPAAIAALEGWGVRFAREGAAAATGAAAAYDLGREAGHSQRRVLHSGDFTGRDVHRTLLERVAAEPNVRLLPFHHAIDVITDAKLERRAPRAGDLCWGAYVLDGTRREVLTIAARSTVLATGGAGKVYLYTTNSNIATGDGVAMAYRAGCRVANMEFFQFHPTCLFHPRATDFLISEALRGEGGILRRKDGTAFMARYHPDRELAPRDVVARSIDREMKESGDDCVFLDMTALDAAFLSGRFPNIDERLKGLGIDMSREPVPVVPAAHYQCGGVVTDLDGSTDLERLYAVGETASTGLHGANRLASNSLLESVVVGLEAARAASGWMHRPATIPPLPLWDSRGLRESDESVVVSHTWDEIRRFMWNYVGIVRSDARLERARRRLELVRDEIRNYYWRYYVTPDLLDLRNLHLVASLIVRGAQGREESRGLHFNLDHPEPDDYSFRRDLVFTVAGDQPV